MGAQYYRIQFCPESQRIKSNCFNSCWVKVTSDRVKNQKNTHRTIGEIVRNFREDVNWTP